MLQYQSFSSAVDVSFWRSLCVKKLDEYQLSTAPVSLVSAFTCSKHETIPSSVLFGDFSFKTKQDVPPDHALAHTTLVNVNTMEEFKKMDIKTLLSELGHNMWKSIINGEAEQDPSLLNRCLMLTFAMIKENRFIYWCAFPGIIPLQQNETEALTVTQTKAASSVNESMSAEMISSLIQSYQDLKRTSDSTPGAFLVKIQKSTQKVTTHLFVEYPSLQAAKDDDEELLVAMLDPSALSTHAGWPLRNLVVFLAYCWKWRGSIRVLCFRDIYGKDKSSSIMLHLNLNVRSGVQKVKTVGWEKNDKNQQAPKMVDLRPFMDPHKLAETSVDLNLKLMRWRALPALDVNRCHNTKALLLGAGTLGCNVARLLLGWGVRHITFVDNGKVSFSNPVRQSLYNFEHCLNGGAYKATAAADSVKQIFPGTVSLGIVSTIPMPGHLMHPSQEKEAREAIQQIGELIDTHDVVFLLTDSREARWLPTMLCAAKNKLVINAALGFDSYVVMRHGVKGDSGGKVGCYYCSDIVAPANSLTDRTLDQQCTVTRPGLAYLASALAVELAISLLHHPQGASAPAQLAGDEPVTRFGIVPQQLRGSLLDMQVHPMLGHAFDKCTACSDRIVDTYKRDGTEFVVKVLKEPKLLEEVSGLTEMKKEAEELSAVWDVDDVDDGDELM